MGDELFSEHPSPKNNEMTSAPTVVSFIGPFYPAFMSKQSRTGWFCFGWMLALAGCGDSAAPSSDYDERYLEWDYLARFAPMPTPFVAEPRPPDNGGHGSQRAQTVAFDLRTKQETRGVIALPDAVDVDMTRSLDAPGSSEDLSPQPADDELGQIQQPWIFSPDDRTPVPDESILSNTVYKRTVLLLITKPTIPRTFGYCSGMMVGDRLVLTAGHCVWDENVNDWMVSVRVVPGPIRNFMPWGDANATKLYTLDGWKFNEDRDYDFGAVALDRSLGSIVGFQGATTNVEDMAFEMPGFPSLTPFVYPGPRCQDSCRMT